MEEEEEENGANVDLSFFLPSSFFDAREADDDCWFKLVLELALELLPELAVEPECPADVSSFFLGSSLSFLALDFDLNLCLKPFIIFGGFFLYVQLAIFLYSFFLSFSINVSVNTLDQALQFPAADHRNSTFNICFSPDYFPTCIYVLESVNIDGSI